MHMDKEHHWVAVTNVCGRGKVRLFDGLGLEPSFKIKQAISSIECTPSSMVRISQEPVQRQLGSADCGVFAAAFLIEVLTGGDPHKARYDQDLMRKHLVQCLSDKHWTPFPKTVKQVDRVVGRTMNVKVYCHCRMPHHSSQKHMENMWMVECGECHEWYHRQCIRPLPSDADLLTNSISGYTCKCCKDNDLADVDRVASLSISRVDVKPLIAAVTQPVGTEFNQDRRAEPPTLPAPRTTVVITDQSQENEDVLDFSKLSTNKSFSPASQFPPISQSNQFNQVVDEPPVRPESTTSVFSEFYSVSGFSSFLKEQSWIEPGFCPLPPAMQHLGQTQLSISENTLQRSDHMPAMTSEKEKTYFPSGQEYSAQASSSADSNIEDPTDQSNQLLSSQTSLQVSRLTLSVRERNYWDGKALKTANSSSLNGNKGTTTHSTPSQQTKVSAGHQEKEDNSQVSDLPINRRFCPPPAQSPLTFQLNVMNQQIDAHNLRPKSTRSNLSDFSSVSGVSSLLEGIQLSPVASQHSTSEHSQPSTALGSDHFPSYQPRIKSRFSTFAPAMQHLGLTQLPISETTQQRSNAILAMTSSKKMSFFSFGQERPEVTSSITDDSIDAPIDQSDQLLSDQTSLQVSRPFFSEIAASDTSMPDASVASNALQSRTDTSSASTPPFTIQLLPILHAASPAQQPPTTVTNGSLDQSCRSIPQLHPSSPVLSPTEHLQTTSSSSDLLSTPNSSSTLSSKTSKRTSVPSSTSVSKEAPILPLHHYPASTESYNAESTPTAAGTKRHAPVDRSMETESGPTPPQVSKYTSEVEGETLKLQHNSGRHLFMFSSDGKVEDFTKDVNRITKADCSIKTSDGYTCIDNVALKALPLPFIVCIGNSETTVTSRTGQENAPIASTSSNSGEAAAVENPASRFGRMSNADQVVQFLTFVHEHVKNGKTINAALKISGKDRKTADRFRNIYYLHVTNHGRLNELSEEWKRGGRQGALPGLNEQARREVDWRLLEQLAGEGKATLFGGIKRGQS